MTFTTKDGVIQELTSNTAYEIVYDLTKKERIEITDTKEGMWVNTWELLD